MAALSAQYTIGQPLQVSHPGCILTIGHDHTSIADLDDMETLYTSDFTIPASVQGVFFVVTTTGDTTAAHTAAITLMHTASHAAEITEGLIREDQSAPAPATTVTLNMGTAADRNVVLHVNASALETTTGDQMDQLISLRFVGAGSLSNCVVRVSCFGYALRSER